MWSHTDLETAITWLTAIQSMRLHQLHASARAAAALALRMLPPGDGSPHAERLLATLRAHAAQEPE